MYEICEENLRIVSLTKSANYTVSIPVTQNVAPSAEPCSRHISARRSVKFGEIADQFRVKKDEIPIHFFI